MSETPSPEPPVSPPAPTPPIPEEPYLAGWSQGVSDTGAVLVACVASWVGYDTPLVDLMAVRLGELVERGPSQ